MERIVLNKQSREKLIEGVDILSESVKVTLGAKGRNVIIIDELSLPTTTQDGVSVAKVIKSDDVFIDAGIQLVKQAAMNSERKTGDGTTTTVTITQGLFKQAVTLVDKGVINPVQLKRKLDKLCRETVSLLKRKSLPVKTLKRLKEVALVSTNNDDELATLISKAVYKSGKDGSVTVVESSSKESTLEVVEGVEYGTGYLDPRFINNHKKLNITYEKPKILLIDDSFDELSDIVPLLESTHTRKEPLVIVANEISPRCLHELVVNNSQNKIEVTAIQTPGFGNDKSNILQDLSVLTGSKVFSRHTGATLDKGKYEDLGDIDKIEVGTESTKFVGGYDTDERVSQLKVSLEEQEKEYDKEKIQERISKLSKGVCIIHVGATIDLELSEKIDRIDDAVGATRASLEEGILPGGGIALLNITKELKEQNDPVTKLYIEALKTPFYGILSNGGYQYKEIEKELIKLDNFNMGYNVLSEDYEDFIKTGIIDPLKVTRVALENAVATAGVCLTTECIIKK